MRSQISEIVLALDLLLPGAGFQFLGVKFCRNVRRQHPLSGFALMNVEKIYLVVVLQRIQG
jgi:hypothetical protein